MRQVYFNGIDLGKVTKLDEIDEALIAEIVSSLSVGQTLSMMIRGYLELGKLRMENWKGEASFYLFKCPVHGYQITYMSGYFDALKCIPCLREELGLKKERAATQPSIPIETD
jgi:hypothetical protein